MIGSIGCCLIWQEKSKQGSVFPTFFTLQNVKIMLYSKSHNFIYEKDRTYNEAGQQICGK